LEQGRPYDDRARPGLWISAKTGEGVPELIRAMTQFAADRLSPGESPLLTRARHRQALEETARSLRGALAEPEPELRAEQVRLALRAVGRITGRVDLDELLDVVFRDFCIGK
jgi:tRNA modification GTPase